MSRGTRDRNGGDRPARRSVAAVVTCLLLLSGCTGGGQDAGRGATSVRAEGTTSASAASANSVAPAVPAGPTASTPGQWRDGVGLTDVPVDASLRTDQSVWTAIGAVSAAASRPAVVGTVRQQVDRPQTLALWADTEQGWQATSIPVDGSVDRATLTGSADVLAVAGTRWADGVARPFLLTSGDGAGWLPAGLPAALDGVELVAVSVDDERVVALGVDVHDRAVLLRTAPGAPVEVTELPDPPAGERHRLTGVTVSGDTVIVSGYQGPKAAGDRRPPVVHVSRDGGRTVGAAQLVTGDVRAQLNGIVPVPGGFVATGASAETLAADADLRPAAWFSADGTSWRQEDLPGDASIPDEGDSGLGAPLATGAEVAATAWAEASLWSSVLIRRSDGQWAERGAIDGIGGNRVAGRVVGADPGTGDAGVDRLAVALDGPQGVVLGHLDLGVWTANHRPTLTEDLFSVSDALAADVPRVRLSRWTRQTAGDSWTVGTEDSVADLGPSGLHPGALDPAETAGKGRVVTAQDPASDARQVGTSTISPGAGQRVQGWYRAGVGATWTSWQGFGVEEYESADRVQRIGDVWFVSGQRSPSAGVTEPRQGMVWSSVDGVHWTRAEGEFAVAGQPSRVEELCPTTAGPPVAVGWRVLPTGDFSATVWSPGADGRWSATELPADAGSGYADGCTEEGGAPVITGTLGVTPASWSRGSDGAWAARPPVGADGRPYDEETAAEVRRDDPVDVPGGKAAAGYLVTAAHVGPVLWLSRDGQAWDWVPLPVATSGVRQVVLAADGGVLVVTSTAVGISAWRLADTAAVIAAMPTA